MKPISFSNHARYRMLLRGATESEVESAVNSGIWQPAKRGKFQAETSFVFGNESPIDGQNYKYKTVEAVFADEVVVVTAKVYYSDEDMR